MWEELEKGGCARRRDGRMTIVGCRNRTITMGEAEKVKLQRLHSLLLMLFLVVMVAATGCSSRTGGSSETVKEIAIASGADPITLDPRKTWVGPGYSMNAHVFEPLVFREQKGDEIKLVGVLAEKIENPDQLTWKFTLRKGVKFHNGKPLTAEAVKFTIESIMDPKFTTPLKIWVSDIQSVTTEGDSVVIVKTKYPTGGLLSSLAQVPIVEPTAVKEMGEDFNLKPVGTGPYKVVKYTPNSQVVVERFSDYWGKPGTYDRITFRIMPENAVRLAALQSGEVVLAEAIPPDKIEAVKNDPKLTVVSSKTMRVCFLNLELKKSPWLSKKEFRQAISLAIDRRLLVDSILRGTTIPASSVSPPGTVGFNEKLPVYEYNRDKAKALIKEVGYDGSPLKMGVCVGRYNMDKQIGEAVAGMLREAGINVQLEVMEWSSYRPKTQEDYFDIWFVGQTDFTCNPSKHYEGKYDSATSDLGYANPEVDTLMAQAARSVDAAVRAQCYSRIQEILYEDMPTVPLYYEPQIIGVNKGLQGFEPRLDEYVLVGYTSFTPAK